jgi:hypothetical protein
VLASHAVSGGRHPPPGQVDISNRADSTWERIVLGEWSRALSRGSNDGIRSPACPTSCVARRATGPKLRALCNAPTTRALTIFAGQGLFEPEVGLEPTTCSL